METKSGPKTEPEARKTRFGRHAASYAPANQNQVFEVPNYRKSDKKAGRKAFGRRLCTWRRFLANSSNFFQTLTDFRVSWGAFGEQFRRFLVSKFQTDFWAHFWRRAVTNAVAAVRHLWLARVWQEGIQHAYAQGAGGLSRQSRGHRPPLF